MSELHDSKYRNGREVMDSTPGTLPVGFRRPLSLVEQMRSMIRNELSQAASDKGRESFEEANDFDIPDDPDDPTTPWELAADGEEDVQAGLAEAQLHKAAIKAGWQPPPRKEAWQEWAEQQGWAPPPAPSPPPKPSNSRPEAAAGGRPAGNSPPPAGVNPEFDS